MKPDAYYLIKMLVESGVTKGLRRAYKQDEMPTKEQIQYAITGEVMVKICEWLEFKQKEKGWEP